MRFKVKALINFNDLEENKKRVVGEEFECSKVRCDYLLEHKAIEIVEEEKQDAKKEEVASKKKTTRKRASKKVSKK